MKAALVVLVGFAGLVSMVVVSGPPPTTTIDTKPANPTKTTSAAFTYHSSPAGATFKCKLDAEAFAELRASGKSYPGPLLEGIHTFPGGGHRRKRHRPRRQRHLDHRPDAADDDHRHQAGGPKSRSECGVQISRERGVERSNAVWKAP